MPSDALHVAALVPGAEATSPPRLDVNFSLEPGVTVLFGPSGAGKSTTLSVIAGLLQPKRGRVALGPEVLFDSTQGVCTPPHARRISLVFQSLALFPHLSVEQNVAFGVRASTRGERAQKATHWLERMQALPLRSRSVLTLSGGEAQRVALARALASEPRALLLDEPFSALDDALRQSLGAEVARLASELKLPTLLVTHDREDARRLGSRMLQLHQGRVVNDGAPGEVFGRASTATTSS